jgi:hypothetical protein
LYPREGRLTRTRVRLLLAPRFYGRRVLIFLLSLAVVGGLLFSLWWVPIWQADSSASTVPVVERLALENELRRTLATAVAGLLVSITVVVSIWNARTAQATLVATREGQITDRFTKAIELLGARDDDGAPRMEIRLGGIFALERIAADSPRDHWPVIEVLTAYLRQHAPWPFVSSGIDRVDNAYRRYDVDLDRIIPRPDVQAAITVIGRRRNSMFEINTLDMSGVDLRGYDFTEAFLRQAQLIGTSLAGSSFFMADLSEAHCYGTDFREARLAGTAFIETDLQGADFTGADGFEDSRFRGAVIDEMTVLPVEARKILLGQGGRFVSALVDTEPPPCSGKRAFGKP